MYGSGERPRPWLTERIGGSDFGRHGILQAKKRLGASPLSVRIAHGPSQSKAKARNRHLGTPTMTGLASQAMLRGLRDELRGSSRGTPVTYRERGTHPRDRRSH